MLYKKINKKYNKEQKKSTQIYKNNNKPIIN